jgi:hypothetical protein
VEYYYYSMKYDDLVIMFHVVVAVAVAVAVLVASQTRTYHACGWFGSHLAENESIQSRNNGLSVLNFHPAFNTVSGGWRRATRGSIISMHRRPLFNSINLTDHNVHYLIPRDEIH